MKRMLLVLLFLSMAVPAWSVTTVVMKTSFGDITLELDEAKAPVTVKNFLTYAEAGHYDGTIFHRVIDGFMIQGGGFDLKQERRSTTAPIKNEAGNGLKNLRGTIAMARTPVVDSATDQFFINLVDNAFLDHRSADAQGFGYAVFGRVSAGQEVVARIGKVATRPAGGPFQNLPKEPVVIQSVRRTGN